LKTYTSSELGGLPFIPDFKTCPRLAAALVLEPSKVYQSILPILGLEIDLSVSIIVGIIVFYMLSKVGFHSIWFKGIILGLLAWAIIDITLTKLLSQLAPPRFLESQVSLFIHFIYGLTVVFTARTLHRIKNPNPEEV